MEVCALPSALLVLLPSQTSFDEGIVLTPVYLFIGKYVCGQHCAKTAGPICMKFSEMMCSYSRTPGEAFGSNRIKGQGHGHEKVRIVFSS